MEMFKNIKILGKGTYGTVHLCERLHDRQKIVVKQISVNLQGEKLKNAKNEVAILKTLNHPNIIQYYDNYIKGGEFYIVMQYASKGNMFELLTKKRSKGEFLEPQAVMNYFCQILMGLHHIHSKNIIHRDMKCENIFLTGIYGDVIKIGDFGVSKLLVYSTKTDTVIGTCNYLAPELCDGKPYDSKSDIWALGCILYEMCAMEKMFEGSVSNVVLSIAHGRKKSIDQNRYGYQMNLLIEMMLNNNPNERPDTRYLMSLTDVFPSLYLLGPSLGCIFPY